MWISRKRWNWWLKGVRGKQIKHLIEKWVVINLNGNKKLFWKETRKARNQYKDRFVNTSDSNKRILANDESKDR